MLKRFLSVLAAAVFSLSYAQAHHGQPAEHNDSSSENQEQTQVIKTSVASNEENDSEDKEEVALTSISSTLCNTKEENWIHDDLAEEQDAEEAVLATSDKEDESVPAELLACGKCD